MFNRPVSEASSAPGLAGAGPARAELAVTTPSGSVELPSQALTGPGKSREIQDDHHHTSMNDAANIGRIRSTLDGIHRSKLDQEAIDKIREKLLRAGRDVEAEQETTDAFRKPVKPAAREIVQEAEFLLHALGDQRDRETVGYGKTEAQIESPDVSDKNKVLAKIAEVIDRIGLLRDALERSEQKGYEQLLGLNLSVHGLNNARNQVQDSMYSVSAASAAVETILSNVRAAVVAHGRASPDIVR